MTDVMLPRLIKTGKGDVNQRNIKKLLLNGSASIVVSPAKYGSFQTRKYGFGCPL
jgi:hypothetical protein